VRAALRRVVMDSRLAEEGTVGAVERRMLVVGVARRMVAAVTGSPVEEGTAVEAHHMAVVLEGIVAEEELHILGED
jgi:hypothetical protein